MTDCDKTESVQENVNPTQTKSAWLKFFYVWVADEAFSEDVRRVFIINLFATVGILFTFPLGIVALFNGDTWLGVFLLSIAALYAMNHVYLRYTHNHSTSGNFVIYPLYVLMIWLVYTGGMHGTGHVWIFSIPAVSLFLHGMKRGLIELGIFTLALVVIMFFMDNHFAEFNYHESLSSRVLSSFIVVVFLSAIYEYSMSRSNDELKETTAKLKLLAYIDSLTGLFNRRGMLQRLEKNDQQTFYLLLADVDFFKRINDEYGHDTGDYALTKIAEIFQTSLPVSGLAARWGGEEFLVAVPDYNEQEAVELAELIRLRVENYEFSYEGQHFNMTLSFGVASTNLSTSLRETITLADSRLYLAKHSGRNQTRHI